MEELDGICLNAKSANKMEYCQKEKNKQIIAAIRSLQAILGEAVPSGKMPPSGALLDERIADSKESPFDQALLNLQSQLQSSIQSTSISGWLQKAGVLSKSNGCIEPALVHQILEFIVAMIDPSPVEATRAIDDELFKSKDRTLDKELFEVDDDEHHLSDQVGGKVDIPVNKKRAAAEETDSLDAESVTLPKKRKSIVEEEITAQEDNQLNDATSPMRQCIIN